MEKLWSNFKLFGRAKPECFSFYCTALFFRFIEPKMHEIDVVETFINDSFGGLAFFFCQTTNRIQKGLCGMRTFMTLYQPPPPDAPSSQLDWMIFVSMDVCSTQTYTAHRRADDDGEDSGRISRKRNRYRLQSRMTPDVHKQGLCSSQGGRKSNLGYFLLILTHMVTFGV